MSSQDHQNNSWTRVIVLTPPAPAGSGVALPLKAALEAREWFAVEHEDPYLAMAELCLRERAQVSRAAWGLDRMEQIALLVTDWEYWPQTQLNDLIAAVIRYLPAASIWEECEGEIQAIHRDPDANHALNHMHEQATHFRERPASMLSADNGRRGPDAAATPATPAAITDDNADATRGQTRLTREEIDMLLDFDVPVPPMRSGGASL